MQMMDRLALDPKPSLGLPQGALWGSLHDGTRAMNITEVRVKLLENQPDKLRGFASVTVEDCLVIRDLKIIEGAQGLFIAMPSRKLCDRCTSCGSKNHLRARFCNDCGRRLRSARGNQDDRGRVRLYADIAHPIHQGARSFVEKSVLKAYEEEFTRSKQEGYVATRFDDLDYDSYDDKKAGRRGGQRNAAPRSDGDTGGNADESSKRDTLKPEPKPASKPEPKPVSGPELRTSDEIPRPERRTAER